MLFKASYRWHKSNRVFTNEFIDMINDTESSVFDKFNFNNSITTHFLKSHALKTFISIFLFKSTFTSFVILAPLDETLSKFPHLII